MKAKIIAFEKIKSKVVKMKEMCQMMGASSIECICQDATKIGYLIKILKIIQIMLLFCILDFVKYKSNSFDRVLVDAPCSALGQRPLLFNDIKKEQLVSYVPYQKSILENVF